MNNKWSKYSNVNHWTSAGCEEGPRYAIPSHKLPKQRLGEAIVVAYYLFVVCVVALGASVLLDAIGLIALQ